MRLLLLFTLLVSSVAVAARIQILHTNDLHSFFEGGRDGLGGYARLKTLADQLKARARARGMETLFLDGGDFAEGASFYFADRGLESLRMLDRLGVDVSVIGNHDTLQGGQELLRMITDSGVRTQILSANLNDSLARVLTPKVKGMTIRTVGGMRIAIAGLTTSQIHYQYAVRSEGKILPPNSKIPAIEDTAQANGADFLIALTHLGLKRDLKLVRKTKSVDLVVGAHSHTRLFSPEWVKNKRGVKVPIVQAGANSIALGQMILDIRGKGDWTLESYQLHSIDATIPEHESVRRAIEAAKLKRAHYFGRDWDEVIGETAFALHGQVLGKNPVTNSCWGAHIAQFSREATGADVGLHASGFTGDTIPPGPLKFGDLIDSYPHFRQFGDRGWRIAKATLPGPMLKSFLALLKTRQNQFGMDFSLAPQKSLETKGELTLAFPSEIWFAIQAASPSVANYLKARIQETSATVWESMEIYVRARSPLECPP